MAYPIYQRQERVQYPNPRNMVVDWSKAGNKLVAGLLEGVNLGLKIKESRENSAIKASNLKTSALARQMAEVELDITKKNSDNMIRESTAKANIADAQAATVQSETYRQAQEANNKIAISAGQIKLQSDHIMGQIQEMNKLDDVMEYKSLLGKLSIVKDDPIDGPRAIERLNELATTKGSPVIDYQNLTDVWEINMAGTGKALQPAVKLPTMNEINGTLTSSDIYKINTGEMVTRTSEDAYGMITQKQVPELLTSPEYFDRLASNPEFAKKQIIKQTAPMRKKNIDFLRTNMSPANQMKTGLPELTGERERITTEAGTEIITLPSGKKEKVKIGLGAKIAAGVQADAEFFNIMNELPTYWTGSMREKAVRKSKLKTQIAEQEKLKEKTSSGVEKLKRNIIIEKLRFHLNPLLTEEEKVNPVSVAARGAGAPEQTPLTDTIIMEFTDPVTKETKRKGVPIGEKQRWLNEGGKIVQ